MAAPSPRHLASFVRATAVLALSAAQQEAWLASLGPASVDELALEYGERHLLLPQWTQAGWLPSEAVPAFDAVDAALSAMSGAENAHLWTAEALHRAQEWAHVRELAAQVLQAL